MLLRLAHNASGQLVLSLCQDNGRPIRLRAVAQRHCKVRRVSDNHICLWHLLHHTGLGHPALHFFDLSLDLGIAFHLFVFLFDLLFGHAQLPLIVPPLVKHVRAGQHHKGYGDLHHHLEALIHQMGAGNGQIGVEIFRKGIYNSHQELIDQEQQNRYL